MGIIHVRIDDRLIHGQVAAFWCNTLKAQRIMVANDLVANDELQKSVLRMVAPPGVATSIITKARAAENINAGKYDSERVMLILKSPGDVLDLIKLGVEIKTINVGNMAHHDNTVQIKRSINVTQEDIENFKRLSEDGVTLTSIMVPDEPKTNLMDYIEKLEKHK